MMMMTTSHWGTTPISSKYQNFLTSLHPLDISEQLFPRKSYYSCRRKHDSDQRWNHNAVSIGEILNWSNFCSCDSFLPGMFDIVLCVDVIETTGGKAKSRKDALLPELKNNGALVLQSVSLFVRPSVYLSFCLSVCLSVWLSVRPTVNLCLSVFVFVCPSNW